MFFPIMPEIPAEEAMKDKDALDLYERGMTFLYSEIKELNINPYLVEQILFFPPIFIDEWLPNNFYFLTQFMNNAIIMIIHTINKLITDKSKDVFTMIAFQQKILSELLKPEHRDYFQNILNHNELGEKEISDIKKRAKQIRNKRLAHLTNLYFQQTYDKTIKQTRLHFIEIRNLSDFVNYIFFSFAFNRAYVLLPECYATRQADQKTDIETFLDYIAQNSKILNLPETNPDRWHEERSKLSNEELYDINRFRVKFNLEKV